MRGACGLMDLIIYTSHVPDQPRPANFGYILSPIRASLTFFAL